ncbi:MAG: DUF2344 domain-containing protein [Lachnospiraceae bacterium]|nr:DUF2344 domain-containing protein [Lachnospiraceae bacterium]
MKVRLKFRKYGNMKFIGHLDMMRYFQKAIRRSGIPVCYSEGFSPHMIMSFASPLGVGLTSDGEYLDIEVNGELSPAMAVKRLNETGAEGVEVLSLQKIPDGKASNAMALVTAADYRVSFREGCAPAGGWQERFSEFLKQPSIFILKETKKNTRELDIRPLIYEARCGDDCVFLKLAAGSAENLKPELVMEAFASYSKTSFPEFAFLIHRLELYADGKTQGGPRFVPLSDLGEAF